MAKRSVINDLRKAVFRCGKTRYRICKETGILQSTLSRFVHGQTGLGPDAFDALCECIGARLVVDAKPAKPKATKRTAAKPASKKR
jgi:hypothetical protein